MKTIKLPKGEWTFDPDDPDKKLGEGAFGAVYEGYSDDHGPIAVKCLNIDPAFAKRELDIAAELSGRTLKHVIPILDSGQDSESGNLYIVMEKGDMSLDDVLGFQLQEPD